MERSERAGVRGPRRIRSMPPGLGVLRGPAARTQPEPRRERPQPAQPEGSGWGFRLQLDPNCLCLGGSPEFVLQPSQVE